MGLKIDTVDIENYFGVYVLGKGTYGAPERDVDLVHVPGRNGDILIDRDCFHNVTVEYPDCWILDDFPGQFARFRKFLAQKSGYVRISDDYHSGEYRMGIWTGPLEPEPVSGLANKAGRFDLVFNCQPQRWMESGEESQTLIQNAETLPASARLSNPTGFVASPDWEMTFTATTGDTVTITVRGTKYSKIDITGFTSTDTYYITYEADTGYLYTSGGLTLMGDPLVLGGGINTIQVEGAQSVRSLTMTPHWYTI